MNQHLWELGKVANAGEYFYLKAVGCSRISGIGQWSRQFKMYTNWQKHGEKR